MIGRRHHTAWLATLTLGGVVADMPARAADVAFTASLVSDYRFRGVSLSDRHPAVQGGLDLALRGGWSVGAWASSISRYGGTRAETDIYAGHSGTIAGFDYAATAYAYLYPGGHGVSYGEVQAVLGHAIGPASLSMEAAYSPRQRNTGQTNIYVGARAELAVPATALSLKLRGGRESGFYHRKLDWEGGVGWAARGLTLSASMVGTNRAGAIGRRAGRGALFSAEIGF